MNHIILALCFCAFLPGITLAQVGSPLYKITENEANSCRPLSDEEIENIRNTISDFLAKSFEEKAKNTPSTYPNLNKNNIFSDNPEVQLLLRKKFEEYDKIRIGTNWKESPYAKNRPENISKEINSLFDEITALLKKNPFYRANNFASKCDQMGLILSDFAAFIGITQVAGAALPAATTVTEYAAISGLAWDFSPLFTTPFNLVGTSTIGKIGSFSIGFGSSIVILDKFNSQIKNVWGILEEDQTILGAQKNILTALKNNFKLEEQIKDVENNKDLSEAQREMRLQTRYKEAIIKIYALKYIKTYLELGEKSEKYLWALMDLSALLQSQSTITFGYETGESITIPTMPRLIERTPEMQKTLKRLMLIHTNNYKINKLGKLFDNKVKNQAEQNIKNYQLSF